MADSSDPEGKLKVAYIVSRFPKLTETFVLYEILAVEALGVSIELYPLVRERTGVMHDEARRLVEKARFLPLVSLPIISSNLRVFLRRPGTYLRVLGRSLRATWGSRRYLAGILVFFAKAVHMGRLMSQDGVQHIHAHFASHPAAVAYIIHRLTGIPYSFTAHGSDLHRDQHMLCDKIEQAAFVVPISHYNRQIMLETCGAAAADRLHVVHCGVDSSEFQPRSYPAEPDGTLQILCVGSLHEVKGQTYLLEALRLMEEEGIYFLCRLVGDGEDRARLEAQAREAGIEERVHFDGWLARGEVLARLREADVMVLASVPSQDGRREGIPVSIMEAMASGVPVVASRLSGIPELVDDGENGILVEPGDAQGLANALKRFYRAPELRAQYGRLGREKILREFDLTASARRLVELFEGAGR